MPLSARLLLCVILFAGLAGAGSPTQPTQVLDNFHTAAAQADTDTDQSLRTRDMVFMGTDGSALGR